MMFVLLGLNHARIPTWDPAVHMSTGPTGGGGGRENLMYFAVVGTAFIGAGIYVSKLKQSIHAAKNTSDEQRISFLW